jgi:hypothetical protein
VSLGLLLGAALAAGPVLDLSALEPATAGYPVARDGGTLCVDGKHDDNALAVAIVIYGRRPGRSAWGHASLRFLACEDRQLRDVEFEYYRLDATTHEWFAERYPDEPWHGDRTYMRRQRNQLIVLRNDRPVDGGWYAVELAKNREITEAWMPWDPALITALLRAQDRRHEEQLRRLRAREDLGWIEYEAMGDNCTFHIREALAAAAGEPEGALRGSVYPMELLRMLEEADGVRFVVHPGAHALRRQRREGQVRTGAATRLFRPVKRLPVRKSVRERLAREAAAGAGSAVVELLAEELAVAGVSGDHPPE